MLILRIHAFLGTLLALVLLPVAAFAQDALQRIPENALGFAVVQNMAEASDKFEQLLEPFDVTYPAPLTFAKLVTGLNAGLDVSGDLVIALLPGAGRGESVQPMVLLPISNYDEFAASINADVSGEICRVTLLGEDILVARVDTHAMLMNVEHRATMEERVLQTEIPLVALAGISTWIPEQNIAFVLMPTGMRYLSNLRRQSARRQRADFEFEDESSLLSQLFSGVSGTEIYTWLHSNVELAAIGITVDEQSNVHLGEQFVLKKNNPLAGLAPEAIQRQSAKLGLSNKPFVFTAGGPVAPGWGEKLAALLRQQEQINAATNGLESIVSGLWDKEEKAFRLLFEDIRSCSVVMLTGDKDEPLVGNFMGIATVPDVSKYFESLPQVIETWNELTQQSTNDIKPDFELTTDVVNEKRRCEMVVDIASTARDPNVPIINWMLEAAFGPEGKLRFQFVEVDPTTFVFGFATQEQIAELLKTVQNDETVAPQSAEGQATLNLLKPTTPWKALVSPQGCLRWASRAYSEFLALYNDDEVLIPAMPDCPPIGLSVDWNGRRWECELVCPAATWETVAKYLAMVIPQ